MADTYNDLHLARQEWLKADADYKLAALIIAECMVAHGTVTDTQLEQYRTTKQAEVNAWGRYQEITYEGGEVGA